MLDERHQDVLATLKNTEKDQWDAQLSWTKRGWPSFELYRPVFEASLNYAQTILAAHPHSKRLQPLKLGQLLPDRLRAEFKLDQALPLQQEEALKKEMIEAHCGHASPLLITSMIRAQRFKDAWMAKRLLDAAKPVILIVGRGHIQAERGIPWAMNNLAPKHKFTLTLLSLSPEQSQQHSADHLHFIHMQVKAHRNDNPCERFREQLNQLKKAPVHQKH